MSIFIDVSKVSSKHYITKAKHNLYEIQSIENFMMNSSGRKNLCGQRGQVQKRGKNKKEKKQHTRNKLSKVY